MSIFQETFVIRFENANCQRFLNFVQIRPQIEKVSLKANAHGQRISIYVHPFSDSNDLIEPTDHDEPHLRSIFFV